VVDFGQAANVEQPISHDAANGSGFMLSIDNHPPPNGTLTNQMGMVILWRQWRSRNRSDLISASFTTIDSGIWSDRTRTMN
jgi:hypothetical protein